MADQTNIAKSQSYQEFLLSKKPQTESVGFECGDISANLFDYQRDCVHFALAQGRSGLFLDTGLGKTICELEFAEKSCRQENGKALLLTPLAVAQQIKAEADRFGYQAQVIREQSDVREGINICNYDRLDKLDVSAFSSIILDESSILKSYTGRTTQSLISMFANYRFKMAATATPAPNDHMELGQHAEFLSVMPSNEMLMRWFIADQTGMGKYRLKGHAEQDFWQWMTTWSRCAETPYDLGYDGSKFILPKMHIHRHQAIGSNTKFYDGELFVSSISATSLHDIKRQTTGERADLVAQLVPSDDACVIWCDTDYEADALMSRLPNAVEVRGSQSIEKKEENIRLFSTGEVKSIICKPSGCGYGLNWQHCANMIFVGRSFSYESWYQAVRRCYRFGQKREVNVHLIVAEGEDQIGRVIDRKGEDHNRMKRNMSEAMKFALSSTKSEVKKDYNPQHEGRLPTWLNA